MKAFEGYMHGINLGGWLSQCDHTKERYDNFIKEEDIRKISVWGLDHVRVPVDYELVEDKDGNYREDGFAYLDKILEYCGNYHLNMILDLHKTAGFSFDAGEQESGFFENELYQERFYRLWEEFARRYRKESDRLCFELLNEVTEKEYCGKWNIIAGTCIRRIRAIAPDIKILIGGYHNNSIEALRDLILPVDDNIVYNFHCYEPLVFTHQGAPWVESMDTSFRMPFEKPYREYEEYTKAYITQYAAPVTQYAPDAIMGTEFFEDLVQEAVMIALERNIRLYCGEYGVINRAAPEDALKWYEKICNCFDKYGIGRAAWSYKEMDFGIADEYMDSVRDRLLQLL